MKKGGRGSYDYSVDANSGLHVVRWMDSSAVQLSSTHVSIEPMSKVKRWYRNQKKHVEIDCPAIVKEYNDHMGGVDLFDMLMSLYWLDHKSCKWYCRIFFWVLNVAIVNGWILYRRHTGQKGTLRKNQLSLLEFASTISESLVIEQKLPPLLARKGPGRPVRFLHSLKIMNKEKYQNEEQHPDTKKKRKITVVNLSGRFDNIGHFPVHEEPKQRCKV